MALTINGATVISSFWTSFKTSITNKSLLVQYDDDGNVYTIFAFDSSAIAYVCTIWKGTVPNNVISSGYSQATNDSDKSDFETNYVPNANKTIGLQAVVSGAAITSRPLLIAGSDGANARFLSTDTSGRPSIVGAAADGAAIAGNPVLMAGQDGVNVQSIATDGYGRVKTLVTDGTNTIGVLTKTLYSDPNGDKRTIHSAATLTTSGSQVLTWVGHAEWYLIINLKNAPTGSSPTIQFKIEQLDPIDQTTVITGERVFTGALKTSAGTDVIEVPELISDTVKISWTITGSSPSWTGVNVAFCGHGSGNAVEGQAPVGSVADDPPIGVAGVDDDGYIQYVKVDASGNLRVVTQSIPSTATTGITFGQANTGGAANTLAPLRATTYTEQTTNAQRSLKSTSTNDTSAGTGARQVVITYYTATMTGPFTETVTLNGTTAVTTTNTNICFIEKIVVSSVGSTKSNQGTISLYVNTAGTGTVIGSIGVSNTVSAGTVGDNQTLWSHHYVATGKIASIATNSSGTTGNQSGVTFLRSVDPTVATAPEVQLTESIVTVAAAGSGQVFRVAGFPLKVNGPARITQYAVSNGTNTVFYGGFEYSEE
jgi:hypothetical protein